jgi:hypothetical protein
MSGTEKAGKCEENESKRHISVAENAGCRKDKMLLQGIN